MSKKVIGITGCEGFFGKNLAGFFSKNKNFLVLGINKESFNDDYKLRNFLKKVDIIIHLAGVNRDEDQDKLYDMNIQITERLILFMEEYNNIDNLIFSSSTQESLENKYGESKKESREILHKFCLEKNVKFTGLVLPNIFGPYGKPFYNSVITTFCHQVINSETPKIINDKKIDFIHVVDVCEIIENIIKTGYYSKKLLINGTYSTKISKALDLINSYKEGSYSPQLNRFEQDLLKTFRHYE